MKIWFPSIKTGSGSDVYVERLSEGLKKKGVEVVVSWFNHLHEVCPVYLNSIEVPPDVDIIHGNSWSGFAFKRKNIPLVVTMHHLVHDPEYAPYRTLTQAAYHQWFIRRYEQRSLGVADRVVAVSHYTAMVARKYFETDKITVIHNGIDTDHFSPGPAGMFDKQKVNLLFVGNSSRRKGFDFLMQVMDELGTGFKLHYTNHPGKWERNVPSNCEYLGKLGSDELVAAYRSSDVFVFPSRYEGFGYVVAEAMACSRPVVATRTSSLPELIESGKSGVLCSPEDAKEFADAIKKLAEDSEFAHSIAVQARKSIVERFTVDQMVDAYIDLYKSINC